MTRTKKSCQRGGKGSGGGGRGSGGGGGSSGAKEASKPIGGKVKRELSDFDKQHAALVARNTKVRREPMSITIQGSVLSGVLDIKPPILPDILLSGEGDTINQRPRDVPQQDMQEGQNNYRNLYAVLEEEEKTSLSVAIKPSLLSGLIGSKNNSSTIPDDYDDL